LGFAKRLFQGEDLKKIINRQDAKDAKKGDNGHDMSCPYKGRLFAHSATD